MTKKEIEIQLALGTLPLWKRIELGIVKPTETPVGSANSIRMSYAFDPVIGYRYDPNKPGARAIVIRWFVNHCKANNYD